MKIHSMGENKNAILQVQYCRPDKKKTGRANGIITQYCRPDKHLEINLSFSYQTLVLSFVKIRVITAYFVVFVRPTVLHLSGLLCCVCSAYSIAFVRPTVLRLSGLLCCVCPAYSIWIFTDKPYFFLPYPKTYN